MQAPKRFYIIAIAALLWNIIGDAAYLMQVSMNLDTLAKTDPYQAHLFAAMPKWVWSAYAIAVWSGTLAAILLLLRRAVAERLYIVSLIAVLVQFGYSFLGTDMAQVRGPAVAIFPAFIILVAAGQLIYARQMKAQGVLR